jgi:hypothetical protein
MHRIVVFPLGNADCLRIDLENGRKVLIDFGNVRIPEDDSDKRVDIAALIKQDLEQSHRKHIDVVAFTHLDNDHICGAGSFFFLEHADKYQSEDRVRITELWVPAAALFETDLDEDAKIIQQEARYRLRQKRGIRVFSRPERLREWIVAQGMNFDEVKHLVSNAGQLAPGFSQQSDGLEFFVHSPFAEHVDGGVLIDRNECSLVMQGTFTVGGTVSRVILGADTTHEVWESIVKQTHYHKNDDRLAWDIFKLAHHCSYLSLAPEKGTSTTKPVPAVEWLFENQAASGCLIVSTSKPIPSNDDDPQPPHQQAANYYRNLAQEKGGEFIVTMEYPNETRPEPLVIEITDRGPKTKKERAGAASAITSRPAPRAG